MNRPFLLFAGAYYYPSGGWGDYRDAYSTLEAALEAAANTSCDWWHIVDVRSLAIVKES